MNSREKILSAIKENQPEYSALPSLHVFEQSQEDVTYKFINVLEGLGGKVYQVRDIEEIIDILKHRFPEVKRIVSAVPGFLKYAEADKISKPHALEDVDIAILTAHYGVAENGAVWLTDELMIERALPFISQHLVCIVERRNIVATMHDAYDLIGGNNYHFGTFVAGPSKTADIEQSLVLGAHGAVSMTVFIL